MWDGPGFQPRGWRRSLCGEALLFLAPPDPSAVSCPLPLPTALPLPRPLSNVSVPREVRPPELWGSLPPSPLFCLLCLCLCLLLSPRCPPPSLSPCLCQSLSLSVAGPTPILPPALAPRLPGALPGPQAWPGPVDTLMGLLVLFSPILSTAERGHTHGFLPAPPPRPGVGVARQVCAQRRPSVASRA